MEFYYNLVYKQFFFPKRLESIKEAIDSNKLCLEGHYRFDLRKTENNITTFYDYQRGERGSQMKLFIVSHKMNNILN